MASPSLASPLKWSLDEGRWLAAHQGRLQYVVVAPSSGRAYLYTAVPDLRGRTDRGDYDSVGQAQASAQRDWEAFIGAALRVTPAISPPASRAKATV